MASFLRKVITIWTLLCFAGALYGCTRKIWLLSYEPDVEAVKAAVSLDITYTTAAWFVVWIMGVTPALVLYFIAKDR
ncbi:MAG TPA: hypothetical protein G4O02_06745 [Caldilineae bacterium]|jgi:hypothetical protein|nr:hypothetical protein [Caldilineae bacterium]